MRTFSASAVAIVLVALGVPGGARGADDAGLGVDAPSAPTGPQLGAGVHVGTLDATVDDLADFFLVCGDGYAPQRIVVNVLGVVVVLGETRLDSPVDVAISGCIDVGLELLDTVRVDYALKVLAVGPDLAVSAPQVYVAAGAFGLPHPTLRDVRVTVANLGTDQASGELVVWAYTTGPSGVAVQQIFAEPVVLLPGESTALRGAWDSKGWLGRVDVRAGILPPGDVDLSNNVAATSAGLPGPYGVRV